MSEWQVRTVAELQRDKIILVEDGNHGENRPLKHEFASDGIPFIRPPDLIGGRVDFPIADRINEVAFQRVRKGIGAPGDILFSHRATVGRMAKVPDDGPIFVTNPGITFYRVFDRKVLDPDFLYYWMQSAQFMDQVWSVAGGSDTFPYASLSEQRKLKIHFPQIKVQLGIGRVLRILDDKIELNRRMSATLEEMARALYRSWFVDFDPVHARALGHHPAHMDPTTAALFPDSFGPDGLPNGWEISSVNDIFDVVMGQSPPGNTYNDDGDGLPFFQGRTDFGFRYPENRKFCSAPSRIAEPESVLLSVRAPVGDLNRAWERCCIGRGVASLSEKAGRTSFGYYAMWSLSAELLSYDSEGTVFGAINKMQLLGLSSVAVPETLRNRFEEIAAPIDSRIRNLTDESRNLAALRDALLPRLMSGELRIRDAEKQVEEVV